MNFGVLKIDDWEKIIKRYVNMHIISSTSIVSTIHAVTGLRLLHFPVIHSLRNFVFLLNYYYYRQCSIWTVSLWRLHYFFWFYTLSFVGIQYVGPFCQTCDVILCLKQVTVLHWRQVSPTICD